jgi:hypothetical protein
MWNKNLNKDRKLLTVFYNSYVSCAAVTGLEWTSVTDYAKCITFIFQQGHENTTDD